jgi:hypothetical protein
MRRMIHFIREFKFGRPQQIAALLLVAFIILVTGYEVLHVRFHATGISLETGPIAPNIHGQILFLIFGLLNILRLPFQAKMYAIGLAFGLSLAGALWWVTRRLYNDLGGYVALALFCFSIPFVHYSAIANNDIIAAWGLYGLLYTAIGVAHTLYAPPRKWRPRILLLGTALGVTAGAYFAAAMIGVLLAAAFMLYLAPGRRKESVGIIAISCVIALLWLLAFYLFDFHALAQALGTREAWAISLRHSGAVVPGVQWRLMELLFAIALITYIAWKRTRYFGNTAPLIACFVLHLVGHDGAQAAIWALPFVFTFIGGIFADLLEISGRKIVAWSLGSALVGYAALAVAAVLSVPK